MQIRPVLVLDEAWCSYKLENEADGQYFLTQRFDSSPYSRLKPLVSAGCFFIPASTPPPMEVVSNRFWLCLLVFGFKSFRTGRDFLLGFFVRPYGARTVSSSELGQSVCSRAAFAQVIAMYKVLEKRLIRFLKSDDGHLDAYIRVWREGQVIAESDDDVKNGYLEVMKIWNARTVQLIRHAIEAGECVVFDSCEETAWRLSSFVCGLDGACALGLISTTDVHRYIDRMVRFELGKA